MNTIKRKHKVSHCIESVLSLAAQTPGMGVSLYRTKEDVKDYNCQAWGHDLISKNLGFVKDKLLRELGVQGRRESEDIQLLIVNEDNSAKALINHLLDVDEEIKVSNGFRNSKNTNHPDFILSVEVAHDLANYSKSYSSITEIVNTADGYFIKNNKLKADVKVYNVVAISELVKHI